jgi:hypothetical protein
MVEKGKTGQCSSALCVLDNPSQYLSSRIDSCFAEYYRRFQDVASFKRKACKMWNILETCMMTFPVMRVIIGIL